MSRFGSFFAGCGFCVFAGGFGKMRVLDVVIGWCGCGGLYGEGGQEQTLKRARKMRQIFQLYFWPASLSLTA
jgi:hypothetical protein